MRPRDPVRIVGKTKTCKGCGQDKDLGFFYKAPYGDGRQGICKECARSGTRSSTLPGRPIRPEPLVGEEKVCTECKSSKDLSLFYKRDGATRKSRCKECSRKSARAPIVNQSDSLRSLRRSAKSVGILICSTCNLKKLPEDFYKGEKRCKQCCSRRSSEYNRKVKNLWPKEEYEEAYRLQSGCCYSCGEYHKVLSGDHCHKTRTRRKLLCNRCNLIIGMAKEDPQVLRNAADYCEEHPAEIEPGETK